jgi:hypothetical protein
MDLPPPIPLGELLSQFRQSSLDGWLLIRGPAPAIIDSPATLVDLDNDQDEDPESKLAELGWRFTIDAQTVKDIVQHADSMVKNASRAFLIKAFNYYLRMDSFLPSPDAEIPTDEEIAAGHLQYLRSVYDGYGPERPDVPCRHSGCGRGAVKLSVFCRRHHFEQVMNQACPFDH